MVQSQNLPSRIYLRQKWKCDDWTRPDFRPTTTSDWMDKQVVPQCHCYPRTVSKSPAVFVPCRPCSLPSANWMSSWTLEGHQAEDRNSAGKPWLPLRRGWFDIRENDRQMTLVELTSISSSSMNSSKWQFFPAGSQTSKPCRQAPLLLEPVIIGL